ncbi:MAG: uroporphyrinogen-III C-methyltransferase [Thiohalorhabdus sp.]|uniref:uroporphyrinogen-III C-methyltransferase n=1 Tax=Thiohalorhabdus sp. TaxID=3094134 RepID=UPI00397F8192
MSGQDPPLSELLSRAVPGGGEDPASRVDLVGAGPGDPGLLTLHAVAALQRAEVVLHDRLIPQEVLDLANPDAERVYVGKARARHHYKQEELNALMVARAREGRYVVRLKGGDPFVFGRGGEEAEALAAEGIPVRIIPGITAAGGCAAYAGIPLTHRDHAYRCQFVTAHRRNGGTELDWAALVQPQQTVVVYMGLHGLDKVCTEMVEAGAPATMPAALVERGTLAAQRVVTGTLGDLPGRVAGLEIQSPALLIVGEVVRLREATEAGGTMDAGA